MGNGEILLERGRGLFVGESELPGANEGTTVFFFYTADIIHTHTRTLYDLLVGFLYRNTCVHFLKNTVDSHNIY